MGPNANLTRSQVLAAGFRKYGVGNDISRVCLSYAIAGLIAMAYSDIDNSSPPPLILDLAGLLDRETKKTTIIFTYMQISLAIGGPKSSNRMSGKMYKEQLDDAVINLIMSMYDEIDLRDMVYSNTLLSSQSPLLSTNIDFIIA